MKNKLFLFFLLLFTTISYSQGVLTTVDRLKVKNTPASGTTSTDKILTRGTDGMVNQIDMITNTTPLITEAGLTRTLQLSDANTNIRFTNTGTFGKQVTIPTNSTVAFPIGTVIKLINVSDDPANRLQVSGTGVTLMHASGLQTFRNGTIVLTKLDTNTWNVNAVSFVANSNGLTTNGSNLYVSLLYSTAAYADTYGTSDHYTTFKPMGENWLANKQIKYSSDFSSTFENRSLVDKEYVDNLVINIPPVSSSVSGIVNNTLLQELGGVDKLINGVRIGGGSQGDDKTTVLGPDAYGNGSYGTMNTAIGYRSLKNSLGNFNTSVGAYSNSSNNESNYNSSFGFYALSSNTTGQGNVAVGSNSLAYLTTGELNTAVGTGVFSRFGAPIGNGNIGVGNNAGASFISGNNNTIIGQLPGGGGGLKTGNGNILIAKDLKNTPNYGDNNVVIGNPPAYPPETTMSNSIMISDGAGNIAINKLSNNTLLATTQTNALINADTTGKSIITKEYLGNSIIPAQFDLPENLQMYCTYDKLVSNANKMLYRTDTDRYLDISAYTLTTVFTTNWVGRTGNTILVMGKIGSDTGNLFVLSLKDCKIINNVLTPKTYEYRELTQVYRNSSNVPFSLHSSLIHRGFWYLATRTQGNNTTVPTQIFKINPYDLTDLTIKELSISGSYNGSTGLMQAYKNNLYLMASTSISNGNRMIRVDENLENPEILFTVGNTDGTKRVIRDTPFLIYNDEVYIPYINNQATPEANNQLGMFVFDLFKKNIKREALLTIDSDATAKANPHWMSEFNGKIILHTAGFYTSTNNKRLLVIDATSLALQGNGRIDLADGSITNNNTVDRNGYVYLNSEYSLNNGYLYKVKYNNVPTVINSTYTDSPIGFYSFGSLERDVNEETVLTRTSQLLNDGDGISNFSTLQQVTDQINAIPVIPNASASVTGTVNNISGQELGGVDKLINGVRIGKGGGDIISNTVIGKDALFSNTTGNRSVALGLQALTSNVDGGSNTSIGIDSMNGNVSGSNNVAVGESALFASKSSNNTAVGTSAGSLITTGYGNTIIGRNGGLPGMVNNVIISDGQGTVALQKSTDNSLLALTQTNSLITADTTGKAIITKEFLSTTSSGSNTGDETTSSIQTKRPLKTIETKSLEGSGNIDLVKGDVGLGNVDNTTDSSKPVSTATQTALNLKENTANKNTANGYAGTDSNNKIFASQLPSLTLTDTFVVASQSQMLALTLAETGDLAVRTDLAKTFILKGTSYSTLADWQELLSPTSPVASVFGRIGSISANAGDYTTSLVSESTNKRYVTDANLTTIANQSGTNTGDNAINTRYSSLVSNATHSGDASGSTTLTLATVNANVGTFGSATQVATHTVNAKGLITAASNTTIQIAQSQVTGLSSSLALKSDLASPTFTGVPLAPTASLGTNTTQLATTAFVLSNPPAFSSITFKPTTLSGYGITDAEPIISTKLSAFNKNFGTATGTVTEGNDSRVLNGQTAFGWGNHASAGYSLDSNAIHKTGNETRTGSLINEGNVTIGIESESPTIRKTLRFGVGGYGMPGTFGTDSYGDKIIFYQGADYDGRFGISDLGDTWIKSISTGSGVTKGSFNVYTGNADSAVANKFTIGGNGNVGISQTSPSEKLDVTGNGKFTGSLTSAHQISGTGTNGGFENFSYIPESHNNVWRFKDSPEYGIGYYQGSSLDGTGLDGLGFHFGNRVTPQFKVRSDGHVNTNGSINANLGFSSTWANGYLNLATNYGSDNVRTFDYFSTGDDTDFPSSTEVLIRANVEEMIHLKASNPDGSMDLSVSPYEVAINGEKVLTAPAASYSTTETKTGGTWIDGKPIYRKVLTFSFNVAGDGMSVPHGITNLGRTIECKFINTNSTRIVLLGSTDFGDNYITLDNIELEFGLGESSYEVILEYTKTTD